MMGAHAGTFTTLWQRDEHNSMMSRNSLSWTGLFWVAWSEVERKDHVGARIACGRTLSISSWCEGRSDVLFETAMVKCRNHDA